MAYVAFGPDEGKLAVIVDVIDQNRVGSAGSWAGSYNTKTCFLFPIKVSFMYAMAVMIEIRLSDTLMQLSTAVWARWWLPKLILASVINLASYSVINEVMDANY